MKSHRLYYGLTAGELVNNGHTIQVAPKDKDDYLTYQNKKYFLKQFHFHVPGENKIENKSFPLEVHFVNSTKDGELLVLAVMFRQGRENPEFKKIIASVPNQEDEGVVMHEKINLDNMIPSTQHYYHFMGSLTTPPCSEEVTWIVLKDTKNLSKSQIKAIEKILKHHNNRPIQSRNNREIDEY